MTTRFTLNAQILVTAAALAASAIGANGLTVGVAVAEAVDALQDGYWSFAEPRNAKNDQPDDGSGDNADATGDLHAAPASESRNRRGGGRATPNLPHVGALWEHGQMSGSGYDCSACVERATGGEKSEWKCDALRGNTKNSLAGLLNFEQKLTGRLVAHELPWECGGHTGEPNCLEEIINACVQPPTPQVFVFVTQAEVEQAVTSAVAAGNANVKEVVEQLLKRGSKALIVNDLKELVAKLDAGDVELRAFYCKVIVELGGSCDGI